MAIFATDIKLIESEVMADYTDGGGRRTSRIIPDGVAGNIFPKVSRLDSVYGRVNLRKVFGAVQTSNLDVYAGAHAIITDAPDNEDIHCTLFSTGSDFDTRTTARDRIESYVTSGPESRLTFLGRQLAGQRSLTAYQRVEESLPEVGDVLCLSNEAGSTVTTYQYVRINDIQSEVRTFEDDKGVFDRRVVVIDTGVALRYEFNGPETANRLSSVEKPAKIRTTTVVDAARYYGIKKLAEAATENDMTVRVASIYTPIVPTTNRETPVSNETVGDVMSVVAARSSTVSDAIGDFPADTPRYTRRPIVPGSLVIDGATDDKMGGITAGTFVGEIDYINGAITRTAGDAGGRTVVYKPGAPTSQIAHTLDVPVDLNNRGMVYSLTLNPLPAPGSTVVDYRALGRWYRLRDNGAGQMAGLDPAYGTGSVNYTTGALVITLGSLPDVDSSVLVGFGSPTHYTIRAGGTSDAATSMRQTFTLPDLPINPDSFSITYTSGGSDYTATDDASGNLSGGGITGTVNYTTGAVTLNYSTRLPDSSTSVACAYQQMVPTNPSVPVVNSLATASAASTDLGTPIVAGSLVGSVPFSGGYERVWGNIPVYDDGAGLLKARAGFVLSTDSATYSAVSTTEATIGTVNYATGEVVINAGIQYLLTHKSGNPSTVPWITSTETLYRAAGTANWGWKSPAATSTNVAKTHSATFAAAPLKLDLTTTVADKLVSNSIMFALGGKTYIDRNGTLYADVSTTTGAGTIAGSVDYAAGTASLTHWAAGASPALSVMACLSVYGEQPGWRFQFRTPGSPIRPGSFYIQATTTAGDLVSATASESGVIAGTYVRGTINQETGVGRVEFGQMVAAAGNESEWWYDAGDVVGGQIFKPTLVQPSAMTFNCVVLTNLPLNADILGIDPVRLPMDGRVPIYRPADVVVIHNTQTHTLPNSAVVDTSYLVGRLNLSELWLEDSAGKKVNPINYSVNLAAGQVTMAPVIDLAGLTQPLKAKHRIEDMILVSDVQIHGLLTLASPLSRDYPLDSYVSSSLLFGDLRARVTDVFDLLSFFAWSDTPGPAANAGYNKVDYPIEVLNNGAINERWRIHFISQIEYQVIGENLGVIATGSINGDCAPVNGLTTLPYFIIRQQGWGSGWSAGNNLRFNTFAAAPPIWLARTVLPGASLAGDSFSLQVRGDVDDEE